MVPVLTFRFSAQINQDALSSPNVIKGSQHPVTFDYIQLMLHIPILDL